MTLPPQLPLKSAKKRKQRSREHEPAAELATEPERGLGTNEPAAKSRRRTKKTSTAVVNDAEVAGAESGVNGSVSVGKIHEDKNEANEVVSSGMSGREVGQKRKRKREDEHRGVEQHDKEPAATGDESQGKEEKKQKQALARQAKSERRGRKKEEKEKEEKKNKKNKRLVGKDVEEGGRGRPGQDVGTEGLGMSTIVDPTTTTATTTTDLPTDSVTNTSNQPPSSTKAISKPQPKPQNQRFILFIGNLPYSTNTAALQTHFCKLQPFTLRHRTCKLTGRSKGFAFIEFDDYDKMKTCLKLYHHSLLGGGKEEEGGKRGEKDQERKGKDVGNGNGNGNEKGRGKRERGRRINVELTAGGGGAKSEARKERIRDKNAKLTRERERDRLRRANDEAKRQGRGHLKKKSDESSAQRGVPNAVRVDGVDGGGEEAEKLGDIHPSRRKRVRV